MVLSLCTYPVFPWVSCSDLSIIGYDSSVIRQAASGLRWREGVDYVIRCLETKNDVLSSLFLPCGDPTHCDAAFGDIVPDIDRSYYRNITYSQPYQCTSLAAMTTSTSDTNIWSIFTPFSWQLWVLLISLPFMYGVIMTCLDFFIHRVFKDTKHSLCKPSTLPEFVFDHASVMLGQGDRHELLRSHRRMYRDRFLCVLRMTIQIMFLAFAFLCFVISSTYTAELTNILIKREPRLSYTTFESLLFDGRTIVPRSRLEYFRTRWNVEPESITFENSTTYMDAMRGLQNGTYDGIIANRDSLQFLENMDSDCSVSIVPKSDVAYYGPVIAWSPCVRQPIVKDMDSRILELEMDGTLEQISSSTLRDIMSFRGTSERTCVSRTTTIGIRNVAGVFVILAAATSVPVCFIVSKYIVGMMIRFFKKHRDFVCGVAPIRKNKSVKSMDSYESPESESV